MVKVSGVMRPHQDRVQTFDRLYVDEIIVIICE
jgi:hypothetical protein